MIKQCLRLLIGGLIALDKNGNMAMPFNTEGMFRGAITKDGKPEIRMYAN